MQAHYPAGSPYRSTRHAFASVWREGGLRALYRGTDATTLRGVVLSVSQICAYDQLKQSLKRRGVMQEGLALHFTASMFAGFICSVTSNPVGSFMVPLFFLSLFSPGLLFDWTEMRMRRCCQSTGDERQGTQIQQRIGLRADNAETGRADGVLQRVQHVLGKGIFFSVCA